MTKNNVGKILLVISLLLIISLLIIAVSTGKILFIVLTSILLLVKLAYAAWEFNEKE